MKQTAIEWLFLMLNNPNSNQDFANKLLEQAKAMEKEQIEDAFKDAQVLKIMNDETRAEQYYNKIYKK